MLEMLLLCFLSQTQRGSGGTEADYINQLSSKNAKLRVIAARELAQMGSKLSTKGIDAVVKALDDLDYDVRWHALLAIGAARAQSSNAITALIKILESERTNGLSWQAELALQRIGKPAVKLLVKRLTSEELVISRVTLYNILGEIGAEAKEAIPAIEEGLDAASVDSSVQAARAIIRIDPGNKSVKKALNVALQSADKRLRLIAAESLARSARFKTKEALNVLLKIALDDHALLNERFRATIALSHFGSAGKGCVPELINEWNKGKNSIPHLGVYLAGAIVKLDNANNAAKAYLSSYRAILEEMVNRRPENDRTVIEFAKDILELVRK